MRKNLISQIYLILNSPPVLVARYFQYRVEEVWKKLILTEGAIGKSKYYAIATEFQIRGSPLIHWFIWVIGAQKLASHNVDESIDWLDNIVCTCLPDPKVDFTLYKLLKTYKIYQHSETCKRYKKITVINVLVEFSQIEQ